MTEIAPSRELDAMIWQALNGQEINVLKCRYVDGDVRPHAGYPVGHISPPNYSTDIAASWQIVEEINKRGNDIVIEVSGDGIIEVAIGWFDDSGWSHFVKSSSRSVSHAICLAALKAAMRNL